MTKVFHKSVAALSLLAFLASCGDKDAAAPEEVAMEADAEVVSEPLPQEEVRYTPKYGVKLYAMDCGTVGVSDLDIFSTEGDYAGQSDTFTNTCFLIQHPEGNLIWDFGLPAALVGQPAFVSAPFSMSMDKTIKSQLAELNLSADDIQYAAISHSHSDHTGQLPDFVNATWLVNEDELAFMAESNEPEMIALLDATANMFQDNVDGERDLFGDGSVIVFKTPGHTPGHMSLQVTLDNAGPVLLTGDLYHRKESRELQRVPRFNTDAEETTFSMAAFESRARRLEATVVIQHEPDSIAALPDFPAALD